MAKKSRNQYVTRKDIIDNLGPLYDTRKKKKSIFTFFRRKK